MYEYKKAKQCDNSSTTTIQVTPGNKLAKQQKIAIQKTLAEKLITIGFGYMMNMKAVRKRHKIAISALYYNNTMSSIVRKVFRTLENFLINQCHQQNIKPVNHAQGSLLRSPMLQCAKWMKKEELDTFYKFICRTYSLKKVYITENQASRLYGQIKQASSRGHQVFHIILSRIKKKSDQKNSQGLVFSYAPSGTIAKNVTNINGMPLPSKCKQN